MTLQPQRTGRQVSGMVIGLATLFGVAACASMRSGGEDIGEATGTATAKTRAGFGDAVAQPLDDFGVRKEEIPQPLLEIDYIYAGIPAPEALTAVATPQTLIPHRLPNCADILGELLILNEILGPDADDAAVERSLAERSGDAAADLTLGAVRSTSSGWIPFRGLVREATGAARHDRRLEAAYRAGQLRRAFLKGAAASQGCPAGVAPKTLIPPSAEPPGIEAGDTRTTDREKRWGEGLLPPR